MTPNGTRMLMLVHDSGVQLRSVAAIAARSGWRTIGAGNAETGIAMLGTRDGMMLDAILIDRGDASVAHLIAELRERRPLLPILVLTSEASVDVAVAAMRSGATDFLVKPIGPDRLLAALETAAREGSDGGELRPLTEKIGASLGFEEIVGSAPKFRAALAIAAKAARARVPVLIEGESGVGKAVLADAMHAASPRAKRPLIVLNCGTTPANAIESELFGHEQGAFTGAFSRQIGKCVDADGGTLVLDEIGEMPFGAQVKLLRLLQSGEIHPLGSRHPRQVDVRVIGATNRTLLDQVAAGHFREDLYYRLAVVQLTIPPLRERRGDVPALARHLLARIARQPGLRDLGITDEAMALLARYGWPGNVRQLHDALFRAAVLCEGDALTASDFPHIAAHTVGGPVPGEPAGGGVALFQHDGNLRPLDAIEADVIRLAIGHYRGRMTEVARRLGIGRSTLYRKLAELGISDAA